MNLDKIPISFRILRLIGALILSTIILSGAFDLLVSPRDERIEQFATTLATTVVTAWITYFSATTHKED